MPFTEKKINWKPPSKFHVLIKAAKKHVIWLWSAQWKFLIFIIRFSQGEAGQVSGALLFMAEFGQILPFSSTHCEFFWLISSEISWDIELILVTCVIILQFWKKIGKVVKNCSSRTLFGQKLGQHGPHTKWSSIF